MGLSFNYKTKELYIADAYYGLVKVPYDGGAATQLVSNVLGNPFGFLAGADVDPNTGIVYFTEASYYHKIRDLRNLLNSRDIFSGSLFRYNPTTKVTTLLLRNLAMATGVAVSSNGSFVLVSEYKANRIRRFWLTGPNAYTSDIFLWLPGRPDNIKRTSKNEFWVAVNYPFGSPPPPVPPVLPLGLRINEQGLILEAVPLVEGFGTGSVSEVHEAEGKLYATSLRDSYVNILTA
ncbi:strictosidine synthase [Medicago truncatula]|uniref:Strictosidine synthase n=3 Tax=Medicago truncatula TaxID=3880 RepID=G7IQK6_MEDTR|nr:strictosidine synthase [Medicago truncatula]